MKKPRIVQYGKTIYRIWSTYAERLTKDGRWIRVGSIYLSILTAKE